MTATRILVVEDSAIIARDIQSTLTKLGYEAPAVAYSEEMAIESAASIEPDLVLMDVVLKGEMDGIEASAVVRERFGLPVMDVTAHADDRILERATLTEPFGYVLKPFGERELHVAIEMALYKHRAEQERARLARELEAAQREIKTLRGIIPSCSSCKKIRDDEGCWTQVEVFIAENSEAQMSHGICPTCAAKLYPDLAE